MYSIESLGIEVDGCKLIVIELAVLLAMELPSVIFGLFWRRAEMEPEDIIPAEQASLLVNTKIEFDAATAVVLIVRPVNTIVFGPAGSCTPCGGICDCCCCCDPRLTTIAE